MQFNRRQIEAEQAIDRWPRLFRAIRMAAILTHTEAACALRDWYNQRLPFGGEAINHFGGTNAVLLAGIRFRHVARQHQRKIHHDHPA